jgi:hypothetical protein
LLRRGGWLEAGGFVEGGTIKSMEIMVIGGGIGIK